MRARLLASYVLFACALLLILEIPLGILQAIQQEQASISSLSRQATAMAALTAEDLERGDLTGLKGTARAFAARAGLGIVVLDRNGNPVIAAGPGGVVSVAVGARSNLVRSADQEVSGRVPNPGGGDDLLYDARPVGVASGSPATEPGGANPGADAAGVLVAVTSTSRLDGRVHKIDLDLIGVGIGVLAAAVIIALVLSRSLSRPVVEIIDAVERIAGGDLGARAPQDEGPSELRVLAGRVNVMAARLDHLLGAQRAFVADASHQLRTPLAAMRLRLENLRSRAGAVVQADVDACVSEVARLSRLVDGLLALARAEQGTVPRSVVDLDALTRERADAWATIADERSVVIDVQLADHGTRAWAVPGHLEQVLDNLLDNAVEATPPGRRVHMVVANGGPVAELHVVDEGSGLTAEERRRAFDRFWRGADTPGGSGLGLAIVRQLVEACGGAVELRGAPSGGVDAAVTLERAP